MAVMRDICGGSQRELSEGETLYCTCGLVARGPVSVPVHDVARHPIPVERVTKDIDRGVSVYLRRAEERFDLQNGPRMFFTRRR